MTIHGCYTPLLCVQYDVARAPGPTWSFVCVGAWPRETCCEGKVLWAELWLFKRPLYDYLEPTGAGNNGKREMELGRVGIVRSSAGIALSFGDAISRIRVSLSRQIIVPGWNFRYKCRYLSRQEMHLNMAAVDLPLGSDLAVSRSLQIKPFGSILSQPFSTFALGCQYSVRSAKFTCRRSLPARSEKCIT